MTRPLRWTLALAVALFADSQSFAQFGSPIISPPPPPALTRTLGYYGWTKGTDILSALNKFIDNDCNATGNVALALPAGTLTLSATPHTIVGKTGCSIYGVGGGGTIISFTGNSGLYGTVFTLGQDGSGASNTTNFDSIHDLEISYALCPGNNCGADVPTFKIINANDSYIWNISFVRGSTAEQVGDAESNSSRIYEWGWSGDLNNGGASDKCQFDFQNAANLQLWDGAFYVNLANSYTGQFPGAFMCSQPPSGALDDTILVNNFTIQVAAGSSFNKPYGWVFDSTNGNVNNQYLSNDTFDLEGTAAIYVYCAAGGTGYIHNIKSVGLRDELANGNGNTGGSIAAHEYDYNCAASGLSAEGITFIGSHIDTLDGSPAIKVLSAHDGGATGYNNDSEIGVDFHSHVTTASALHIGADGWSFPSGSGMRYSNLTPDLLTALLTLDPSYTPSPGGLCIGAWQMPSDTLVNTQAFGCYTATPLQNILQNASFDFWQFGISSNAALQNDIADRWAYYGASASGFCTGSCNSVFSRVSGFSGSQYAMQWQRPSGATQTTEHRLAQQVLTADTIPLAGRTIHLACDLQYGANFSSTLVKAVLITDTGTDQPLGTGLSKFTMSGSTTTSWANLTVTDGSTVHADFGAVTVPSNATEMAIRLGWTPTGTAGSSDTLTITNCNAVASPWDAPYQHRQLNETAQQALFQYQQSFLYGTAPVTNAGIGSGEFIFIAGVAGSMSGSTEAGYVHFSQPMRAPPSITLYNPASTGAQCRDETAGITLSGSTATNISTTGFEITASATSTSIHVGDIIGCGWVADARLP